MPTVLPWTPWLSSLARLVPEPLLYGVGLLILADIPALTVKTILHGPGHVLMLVPSLHKQQNPARLSNGEYPACAAMTTGYVFRVENEAMVYYMQQVGRPGQLTTLNVSAREGSYRCLDAGDTCFLAGRTLTLLIATTFIDIQDRYAAGTVGCLALASLANFLLLRRRSALGWKGQKEPGVRSDLLVLLSQDRWVRLQGLTDDVKMVTSGQWLRKSSAAEDCVYTLITILLHLCAGSMFGASHEGRFMLLCLLLCNSVSLAIGNSMTNALSIYGKLVKRSGSRKAYARRLDMAAELVKEVGTDKWCEKMGIILTENPSSRSSGAAHM